MDLPDILSEENIDKAAKLLHCYYLVENRKTGLLSTGSLFDSWAGGGDSAKDRDRITDSELIAVSMLSVTVPAKAAVGFRGPAAAKQITDLLSEIPTDLRLSDLTPEQAQVRLGKGSAAHTLWCVLRADDAPRWGVGPTTTS